MRSAILFDRDYEVVDLNLVDGNIKETWRSTVPARFKEAVARWGDRTAMRKKEYGLWHDITWNEYFEMVRNAACALMSMGLEKGDCAAIIGDNCP